MPLLKKCSAPDCGEKPLTDFSAKPGWTVLQAGENINNYRAKCKPCRSKESSEYNKMKKQKERNAKN